MTCISNGLLKKIKKKLLKNSSPNQHFSIKHESYMERFIFHIPNFIFHILLFHISYFIFVIPYSIFHIPLQYITNKYFKYNPITMILLHILNTFSVWFNNCDQLLFFHWNSNVMFRCFYNGFTHPPPEIPGRLSKQWRRLVRLDCLCKPTQTPIARRTGNFRSCVCYAEIGWSVSRATPLSKWAGEKRLHHIWRLWLPCRRGPRSRPRSDRIENWTRPFLKFDPIKVISCRRWILPSS